MTARSADRRIIVQGGTSDARDYKLAAVKCYAGGIAMLDSAGYATPAAASVSNNGCVGVFNETVDNSAGAAGDLSAEVVSGTFLFVGTTVLQASAGDVLYAEDDQTVDETQGSNEPRAGFCAGISGSNAWVKMGLGLNA